jgi:conjugative relaxase-like TrwC/TraI family protein
MVMSMHRLSAGAGYQYLLKHTASGDCDRTASSPLTAYYAESGNPPGRWLGTGLAGVGGAGLASRAKVTEPAMANLFGSGKDPVTGQALGRAYPTFVPVAERVAAQVAALPDQMDADARHTAVQTITRVELAKPQPTAVAGFDCTFTAPKSASTLWAVADETTQRAVLLAHRAAVDEAISFLERTALFTRTGTAGCAQRPVRGLLAAAFDHWDTRSGDPNLHTHVVVANKVQGLDGIWRSVDSRALHHAVVAVSEIYDDLFADRLARALPVSWGWRHRGPRRSPAFELDGVDDALLGEFSTRSTQIDAAMTGAVAGFYASHGRGPNRIEVTRLRQQVARATRPNKHVRPLRDLFTAWRHRATVRTGQTPEQLTASILRSSRTQPMTAAQVPEPVIDRLAEHTLDEVMTRRSTWTRWNVLAEAARTTRGVRLATATDREQILDRVVQAVLARSVSLDLPELFSVPAEYQRPDSTSVFTRPGEARYTDTRVLEAEVRLLAATTDDSAPTVPPNLATVIAGRPIQRADGRTVHLAPDQARAVVHTATSGRRVDVLVGPAGTGKTTTLTALRAVWEQAKGRGSVIGLAPSSTAAAELREALGIGCENTTKWLYESVGAGATQRAGVLERLLAERPQARGLASAARLRTMDTAVDALQAETRRWQIRPGQLLVIDEASLVGTFPLDTLVAQATGAGAKVLVVGDHAQLSAIDAGGAFNLLAERGRPAVLTSLWRFTYPWEAAATRRLREGDLRVLDVYEDHDRISAGAGEAMLEEAYTAWQADTEDRRTSILIAPDTRTVDALNSRAHNDRAAAGLVMAHGITTCDGTIIGVGDRVVTRSNNRHLRCVGGYVRNGDLWDVTGLGPDGSLTATRVHRRSTPTTGSAIQARRGVVLPPEYVAAHVDLGYATTTHRAQGITVDRAHVLAAPGMVRENLYVAMTRGRHHNHVYVAVDDVDPTCDDVPDIHPAPSGRDVLERILTTPGAELSATQAIAARQSYAASRRRLGPIRQTLIADASATRWTQALRDLDLIDEQVGAIVGSPSRGALFTALERAEALGHPVDLILADLLKTQSLRLGDETTSDLASALHQRMDTWLHTQVDDPTTVSVRTDPEHLPPATRETLHQIDDLIAARARAANGTAVEPESAWHNPLGPTPDEEVGVVAWQEQVAAIAERFDRAQEPAQPSSAPPPPTASPSTPDWSRSL